MNENIYTTARIFRVFFHISGPSIRRKLFNLLFKNNNQRKKLKSILIYILHPEVAWYFELISLWLVVLRHAFNRNYLIFTLVELINKDFCKLVRIKKRGIPRKITLNYPSIKNHKCEQFYSIIYLVFMLVSQAFNQILRIYVTRHGCK